MPVFFSKAYSLGFTLIELVVVIVLLGLIGTVFVRNIGSVTSWRVQGDIRKFAQVWEFLYAEAYAKHESYRLIIDLENNSWSVRREVPINEGTLVKQVDYLAGFRDKIKRNRKKQAKQKDEGMLSITDEFKEEDARQSGALDVLYYQVLFSDPYSPKRLAVPLEFPSLAEDKELGDELKFRDVEGTENVIDQGAASIRVAAGGSSDMAVVHLVALDYIFSLSLNPANGKVSVVQGDVALNKKESSRYE